MPKKTLLKTIQQSIWNFPMKSVFVLLLSTNATLFIAHRGIMFFNFYQRETAILRDHVYVHENICKNNTLKANLGEHYVDICHRAEVDSQKSAILHAFQKTIQNTYLCGDSPCIGLFEQILKIITRSLAWTICAILLLTIVLIFLLVYCSASFSPRTFHRHQKVRYMDLEEQPLQITYEKIFDKKNI